jgi:hypothetical protein
MKNKFQQAILILGLVFAILGIVVNTNTANIFLNITIIFWIGNVYFLQKQLDKVE